MADSGGDAQVRRALFLVPHDPKLDPRIDWFAEGLVAAGFDVCEVGLHAFGTEEERRPAVERLSDRRTRVRLDGKEIQWGFVAPYDRPGKGSVGVDAIRRLFFASYLSARSVARAVDEPKAADADIAYFQELCLHFTRVGSVLLEGSRRIGGFNLVVAADLYTLPAGVALAEEYGVPLVYDAHEYWPYSLPGAKPWQIRYWSDLERTLVKHVTLPITVSPPLAELMTRDYGSIFDCIPNCAPLGSELEVDLEAALASRSGYDNVIFLVQAGFVAERGFDKLVKAWSKVDSRAKLWLRGPDSWVKAETIELARSADVLNRSVFFPPPVSENALIAGSREADVGLIPYEPTNVNNRFCCPNKLSQYMAAGLPVISNKLDYVASVLESNDIGRSVDFDDEGELIRTINDYVAHADALPALSRRAQAVFKTKFNWQSASRSVYARIARVTAEAPSPERGFTFEGLRDLAVPDLPPQEERLRDLDGELRRRYDTNVRNAEIFQAEIDRLNKVYPEYLVVLQDEIARLNAVYTAEISRLQQMLANTGGKAHVVGAMHAAYRRLRRAARPLKKAARALMGATRRS
jgi:glycosyltransferase involved in cell wall biosynthesis